VLGWIWFRESLGGVAVVGCAAVVAGIVLAQSARRAAVVVEPPHL
jgi:drug/metabolite transporter (DMT)-like permease